MPANVDKPKTLVKTPGSIGNNKDSDAINIDLEIVLRPIWQPRDGGTATHTHAVGEVIYFIGGDRMTFTDFGAACEFTIDGETYCINQTTFFYIPPGVQQGMLAFEKVHKPIKFKRIMFAEMYGGQRNRD